MRLLLDTHVAIWAVIGAPQLPDTIARIIEDDQNEVAVSLASLWEIAVKNNLGRRSRQPIGMSVVAARAEFEAAFFQILPIDTSAIERVETLPLVHADPFDRLLVATALSGTWKLVTPDRQLCDYGDTVMTF